MTSHRNCTHPATKAARAKCRKALAAIFAPTPEDAFRDAEVKAREAWEATHPLFAEAHVGSAEQNADDTSREEGFEVYTIRWYETAISTLHHARDCAERLIDLSDPVKGMMIEFPEGYRWVDTIIWREGWASEVILVDDEGVRTRIKATDIPAQD